MLNLTMFTVLNMLSKNNIQICLPYMIIQHVYNKHVLRAVPFKKLVRGGDLMFKEIPEVGSRCSRYSCVELN